MTAQWTSRRVVARDCPARRLLLRVLVVLALVAGLGATATAHAAITETPRDCASVPLDMLADCPTETGDPTPSPQPTTPPAQTDEKDKAGGGPAEQGVQFGQDEEPTGWAGPIAKDLGQGVQGLARDLAEKLKEGLLPEFEFSKGYLTLYAIMFGLGQVIAAAATMIATVKLAERGVESRLLFRQAMIRLLTFAPVAGLTPLALAYAGQLGEGLAQGFLSMAADQLRAQLTWLADALSVGMRASVVVPGGSAVMVGLFLFLIGSLVGVLLELAISHYLVFLLALFVPVLYAASINPKWRGGVTKVAGGLLGAVLAPAALFLVWVVAFSGVPAWGSDDSFFMRAGMLIVGLLLSLAAPLAIGLVLSYVVPAFTGGRYDGTTLTGLAERAGSKVAGGGRPQGPRSSRSQRASNAADHNGSGRPTETPSTGGASGATAGTAGRATAGTAGGAGGGSAAGAGAGAAAGPVGAAAAVWLGMVNKVRSTAAQVRDTVGDRTESTDQAHRGGAEGDDQNRPVGGRPDQPSPNQSNRSTRNVGDTADTGGPGGQRADAGPPPAPRRADGSGAPDDQPRRSRDGGLGPSPAGPGFTPATGADLPGRGRSDDRGDA